LAREVEALATAVKMYYIDTGTWPYDGSEWMSDLTEGPCKGEPPPCFIDPDSNWKGPYVNKITNDPWGNPYILATSLYSPGLRVVVSGGPNGNLSTGDLTPPGIICVDDDICAVANPSN